MTSPRSATVLAGLLALPACSLVTDGEPLAAEVFDGRALLEVPREVRYGEPFRVTIEAQPVVSGTGYAYLSAGVDRLRVLSPVRDTVTFEVGQSAAADSVRVALVAGERVRVPWTVVVDDLEGVSVLNPQLSATVAMDSVRAGDGRLVALGSDEGLDAVGAGRGGRFEGVADAALSGAVPLRLTR